jgi:hypothetical protein
MAMDNFRRLATMTPQELAYWSTPNAPTVAAPHVGLGVDADQFETIASDSTTTARAITKAAKLAKSGGPPLPELSATAKAILAAGVRRRAGG